MNELDTMEKAFGLPESVDPSHEYVYRSGSHGIFDYWYKDNFGNYWQYTNAPEDHEDYDKYGGAALIVDDQPMSHTAPQFFTPEGKKLHIGVPQDAESTLNEAYDPANHFSVWYAMYQTKDGGTRFAYLDADVRENLDLWIQYELRIVDSLLIRYRKYAAQLFKSPHPKDKITAIIYMLADQGMFSPDRLVEAKVSDLEFTDMTIRLLGRKLIADPYVIDFFTTLLINRDPNEPLFVLDTYRGREPIGIRHMYSLFKAVKMPAQFLMYWHATHLYSRIMHRLNAQGLTIEEAEEVAHAELAAAMGVVGDVEHLVDFKLQQTLRRNYAPMEEEEPELEEGEEEASEDEELGKSLVYANQDNFGVLTLWSDLTAKRPDELEFSQWLHSTPLHDVTDEEQAELEQQLAALTQAAEEEQPESQEPVDSPMDEQGEPTASPNESDPEPAGGAT